MLDELINIVLEYGWVAAVIVILSLGLIKYIIGHLSVWAKRKTVPTEKNDYAIENHSDLKLHPFFANVDYKLNVDIPTMEFDSDKPIRRKLARQLLCLTIQSYRNAACTLAHENMNGWSSEKWTSEVMRVFTTAMRSLEIESREDGIPDIIIQKFVRWNGKTRDTLHDYVAMLGSSRSYKTNLAKTNTLFLVMNILLVSTLGDAERTLKELNGEITGLEYKGSTLE